jgi:DNA-binding response OmpR family regulator
VPLDTPTVLLVEDERLIREMVESTLEEAGYAVMTSGDGKTALEALEQGADGFAALITDVNLGGATNGWAIATRARELSPAIPVIYVTGDSAHEWSAHGVPNSVLVAKPFVPTEIMVALANLRALQASVPPLTPPGS